MSADIRISGANAISESESDVRINYADSSQLIAAANVNAVSAQAQFYSSDGGANWDQTLLPFAFSDNNHSDPAVDWTSDSTAWAITIALGADTALRAYKSTDGGATWTFDATPSGAQTNVDKEAVWVDHSPTSPHKDTIYLIWQTGPAWVARRTGPGGSWQAPLQVSGSETTGSTVGADIKTNAQGDVFAFWPDTGSGKLFMAKSVNGGVAFGTPVAIATTFGRYQFAVPAQATRKVLIYISGGAFHTSLQDLVFAAWADLSGEPGCTSGNGPGTDATSTCKTRIWFARSTDGGATWEAPRKINDQSGLNDQFFPRLAVDDTTGELAIVYYDTVDDPGRKKADIWLQTSPDGGVTWTAASKVTSAPSDETASGAQGNQYGDYIGLTGNAGSFFACWTDRRSGGVEEIWGAPIQLVRKQVQFEIDRDHYGQDEIDALRTQPGGAVVRGGFWVVVDGFTPRELGITGPGSTGVGPPVAFSPSTGVQATCTSLDSTDPLFSPDELQRFRFGYDVNFGTDDSAFTSFAGDTEAVTLTTSFQGMPASAQVTFMKQPDPYILQGADTWWLSSDVRLIQVAQGDPQFGVTMGTDPFEFLTDLTNALEAGQGTAGGQSFDANIAEDNEVISVAPQTMRNGQLVNVYNFAIARVHYRGLSQPADHVRVFFRLFAANSTATDFHPDTTYRRDPSTYPVPPAQFGQHLTPTPGVAAGDYVSIPCFGAPRQDPAQSGAPNTLPSLQFDTFNDRTLAATGGPVHDRFYGCFLDINQAGNVLPQTPPPGNPDGPWPPSTGVALETLRESFIRNDHQCLVAEIAFDPVAISPGTQPFNSDKLAQRNISWSYAANPGVKLSRGAVEPFEVRPTPALVGAGDTPDELMIDWRNVPPGEQAEIYLPAVSADALLSKASELYPRHRLSRVDNHTVGCLTGGVSYIPLPPGSGDGANFAGLMTIGLPAGIKRGQLYTVVVRQLTNAEAPLPPPPPKLTVAEKGKSRLRRWRRVLGTFQVDIPVSTRELLLEREALRLSIFRWMAQSIPHSTRWYPVFERYLRAIGIRVSELGGDPARIRPSRNGYDGLPPSFGRPERLGEGEEIAFTGKIEAIIYDHFGDFDGFVLELEHGQELRFSSREGEVEALVREAWEHRIVTTVLVDPDRQRHPVSIALRRSSALPERRGH